MNLAAKASALFRPRSAAVEIGPIGIDFSLESLHLVQLQAARGELPAVRARVSLSFDRPRREILQNPLLYRSVMKSALSADDFHGRRAVIAIPSGMFRTMSINYRASKEPESESTTIVKAMRDRLDGDLADYVLDYLPVTGRSKNDDRLALVAVSQRDKIVEFLELARKSGLDVTALEIGPVAISRLVGAFSRESDSANVLVINSGRRASFLTLISGSDLLFDQEVSIGETSLIRHTAETLDMTEDMAQDLVLRTGVSASPLSDPSMASRDDASLVATISEVLKPQFLKLVDEIKRACMYAAAETRGGGVSQIYLLGSFARWPGADELLGTMIGTNVAKIPDPLELFPSANQSGSRGSTAPEIVVATGAAMRGMKPHA